MSAAWEFVYAAAGETPVGAEFQQTLMRVMAQKLRQAVGDKRPCIVEIPAELGLPPYLPTATIPFVSMSATGNRLRGEAHGAQRRPAGRTGPAMG